MRLRIGSRSSTLALWQANRVRSELEKMSVEAEIVHVKTTGDQNRVDSIIKLGAQGIFVKEIQMALLDGRIDLAVHSLKDLPVEQVPGLVFAATLERENVSDLFLSRKYKTLSELPAGARIGTGSLRRRCQLLHRLQGKHMRVDDLRGNVETRLCKLDQGEYDAIILAAAGLMRLGLEERVAGATFMDPLDFLPAPGQGALGLECRSDDIETSAILEKLNRREVYASVIAERSFLNALRGGCVAPIGAYARIENGRFLLDGRILSTDGKRQFDVSLEDTGGLSFDKARYLGQIAAEKISTPEVEVILEDIRRVRQEEGGKQ